MSRHRRSKAQSIQQAGEESVETQQPAVEPPPQRFAIGIALALWATWLLALIALAMFSSNPVSINRVQIAQSELVAVGKASDPAQGKVDVSETLFGELDAGEIVIENLDQIRDVQRGQNYIFPLKAKQGVLTIVALPGAKPRPVIYPATDAAKEEIKTIYRELLKRPQP